MALQDLTPQLRTRLDRVERAVGVFVTLATLILLTGFVYYVYHTAKARGWFVTKIPYQTSLNNAAGLKPGDSVKLMGFNVGEITKIEANDPSASYGVTVNFEIKSPYYGYLWSDSKVRVSADFLNTRSLEVLKGVDGLPTVYMNDPKQHRVLQIKKLERDELLLQEKVGLTFTNGSEKDFFALLQNAIKKKVDANPDAYYQPTTPTNIYWLPPLESPALTERLETVVSKVEQALPNFLRLTNQLASVVGNADATMLKLHDVLTETQPSLTNFHVISSNLVLITSNLSIATVNLQNPNGSLGQWLIPTNTLSKLNGALDGSTNSLAVVQTNLLHLDEVILNLAALTSNLNHQVEANSNILANVSSAVVHSDEMVQGLKKHWLFRSAFKEKSPVKEQPVTTKSKTGK
jgi:hypothetical protein